MNADEYQRAIAKAKAHRAWSTNNLVDDAARVSFERDFADPLDDAGDHVKPPRSADVERLEGYRVFVQSRRVA
jgi:hypothetical protein